MLLSICIPNYNRSDCLDNCLNSIKIAKKNTSLNFEVCISDNCSKENLLPVIKRYKKYIRIKFRRNKKNFGMGKNIVSAVAMASGEFVWVIGNDDLLIPNSLEKLNKIILKNKKIDFFFINSYLLNSKYFFNFSQPFNTKKLPKKMKKFSNFSKNRVLDFHDLIDPRISFDYLLGLYLSVFRRSKWNKNLGILNKKDLTKSGTFSSFENTCPHVKVFSKAFSKSKAYIFSGGLTVNLSGRREWSNLYSFIESMRIPEALDYYYKFGLPLKKYIYCKNRALINFLPALIKITIKGEKFGLNYIKIKTHIFRNMFFPYFYLSPIIYLIKKILK